LSDTVIFVRYVSYAEFFRVPRLGRPTVGGCG
jgi:hypothetical protein